MRRFLIAMTLVAACRHTASSSSETRTETSTATETTSEEHGTQTTTTVVTEAPGTTTTTVEEFSPPEGGDASDAPSERGSESDGGLPATPGVVSRPSHGPLVRRTVTVTEHGQETSQTRTEAVTKAEGATETKAQASGDVKTAKASESKPAVGCAVAGWMWGVLIIAGIVGIILGALKLRP